MAEIPPPSCFGISSPMLEPSTPLPASAMSPLPIATAASPSSVPALASGAEDASASQSRLAAPSMHGVALQPPTVPPPPSYPFYFNNVSHPVYNSHTSLPLYEPTGLQVQPPPSMFRRSGYSQFEMGSSCRQPHLSASASSSTGTTSQRSHQGHNNNRGRGHWRNNNRRNNTNRNGGGGRGRNNNTSQSTSSPTFQSSTSSQGVPTVSPYHCSIAAHCPSSSPACSALLFSISSSFGLKTSLHVASFSLWPSPSHPSL
ncbi:hypothetical protein Cgig2_018960 [Carnegiea gigantea]|uniref:Uncharacterized protein n=1 Tax=Carnegiea gigantea TaxID=171969 RepID=A0A9Q1GM24_9CARY|nr:hypothetical protein Cgig2_018960 [Carnegiea gigantea]